MVKQIKGEGWGRWTGSWPQIRPQKCPDTGNAVSRVYGTFDSGKVGDMIEISGEGDIVGSLGQNSGKRQKGGLGARRQGGRRAKGGI